MAGTRRTRPLLLSALRSPKRGKGSVWGDGYQAGREDGALLNAIAVLGLLLLGVVVGWLLELVS